MCAEYRPATPSRSRGPSDTLVPAAAVERRGNRSPAGGVPVPWRRAANLVPQRRCQASCQARLAEGPSSTGPMSGSPKKNPPSGTGGRSGRGRGLFAGRREAWRAALRPSGEGNADTSYRAPGSGLARPVGVAMRASRRITAFQGRASWVRWCWSESSGCFGSTGLPSRPGAGIRAHPGRCGPPGRRQPGHRVSIETAQLAGGVGRPADPDPRGWTARQALGGQSPRTSASGSSPGTALGPVDVLRHPDGPGVPPSWPCWGGNVSGRSLSTRA